MEIENFMPKYPNIFNFDDPLFNPYDEDFADMIVTKKELQTLKLSKTEDGTKLKRGEYYNHQKMITRFMSSLTPYNELLLFHEMGTGKTCTAISVIENLRYEKTSNIKQALVIARGTGLLKNFINELLFKCTDGRYIPAHYDKLTDTERVHRIKKETNKFYVFYTFETFARYVSKQTDAGLLKQYSNTVVVIDEIHNIREKDSQNAKKARKPKDPKKAFIDILFRDPLYIYKQFHRFLHVIKQSKILLMSGTVMKSGKITNQHGF
jgi:SNF2 family DNA or RNA helicase